MAQGVVGIRMKKFGRQVGQACCWSIASLTLASCPVFSQLPDPAHRDGDVIVVGRSDDNQLRDVPAGISVLSGAEFEAQHRLRLQDLATVLPNFSGAQQNMRSGTLIVRGLGAVAGADGVDSSVGLFVDGVPYSHLGLAWLDLLDIDRVELFRGPQPSLLGRAATAGALIVTSRAPVSSPEFFSELVVGDRGRVEARFTASNRIGDGVAFRLSGSDVQSGGWLPNRFDGSKLLDIHRSSIRGQLLFQAGASSDRLIADTGASREHDNGFVPLGNGAGLPASNWEQRLGNLYGYRPPYADGRGADVVDVNQQGMESASVTGISNRLALKLGTQTLSVTTAWRAMRFRPDHDSDLSPFPILKAGIDLDVRQFTQEVRLASEEGGRLHYGIGAVGALETLRTVNRSDFQSQATAFLLSPTLPAALLNGLEYDQAGRVHTRSVAAVAEGSYRLTGRLKLAAALRYGIDDRRAENIGSHFGQSVVGPAFAPYQAAVVNAFGGDFTLRDRRVFHTFGWSLGPSIDLTPNLLAYLTFARAEKPGGANLAATPGKALLIEPERADNLELGIKGHTADGRFQIGAALYSTEITNYQTFAFDPNRPALGAVLGNAARVRARGVEADMRLALGERLMVAASGAFNDAVYRRYPNAPGPAETGGGIVDLSGRRVIANSRWTGRIDAHYRHPLGKARALILDVEEIYRSATNLYNPLSALGEQPGYALTHASAGISFDHGHRSLRAWCRNLTDSVYAIGLVGATAIAPAYRLPGEPRAFGISLAASI